MNPQDLQKLDAVEATRLMSRRELKSEDLVRACLERVAERDGLVRAFASINPASVLAKARELDSGPIRGLLHGLPLAVKDFLTLLPIPPPMARLFMQATNPKPMQQP